MNRKVLLIGLDAADWKIINPLLTSGQMPTIKKFIKNGVISDLTTLNPPISPILWTSIVTGHTADKHGIINFIEPDINNINNGGVRTINITSRKTKALWNIFHYAGKKSNVVGWWPSHPAEPINGVMVSNYFHRTDNIGKSLPSVVNGTIYPKELYDKLVKLRVHPENIKKSDIISFVPNIDVIDYKKNKRLAILSTILAQTYSIFSVSKWLIKNTEWDFMAVLFDGIDGLCHNFMEFYYPKQKGIKKHAFELYKNVISEGYKFFDKILGQLIKLADKNTTIVIVSDHGFYSGQLRPSILPDIPAAPTLEHSPYGILCMCGPNIKKNKKIYSASLLDITPTILTIMGQAVGKDMPGKVLINAFNKPEIPKFISSWDNIEGDFGTHSSEKKEDTYASAEAMKQLIDLGYVDDLSKDKKENIEYACNEAKYYLSRIYYGNRKYDEAAEILEKLYYFNKKDFRYNIDIINCYLYLKKYKNVIKIINNVKNINDKKILDVNLLKGMLYYSKNKNKEALKYLKIAKKNNSNLPSIYVELGKVYLRICDYNNALKSFLTSLKIDDGIASAYNGLAITLFHLSRYSESISNSLNAISLIYKFPSAHYYLGKALYMIGMYQESTKIFEICKIIAPNLYKTQKWLDKIYYENKIQNKKYITIDNTMLIKIKSNFESKVLYDLSKNKKYLNEIRDKLENYFHIAANPFILYNSTNNQITDESVDDFFCEYNNPYFYNLLK